MRIAFTLDSKGISERLCPDDLERMIAESIATQPHGTEHFGELFRRYGIQDREKAEAAAAWYRQHPFHGLQLFPESRRVLARSRTSIAATNNRDRRPLGIITNGPAEVQRTKVDLLGISDIVDFVLISEEFGRSKPAPEIFRSALELAGVEPEQAIFVGDSPEFDMAGARAGGIPSVWVNNQGRGWHQSLVPPDREIRSIGELLHLIGS